MQWDRAAQLILRALAQTTLLNVCFCVCQQSWHFDMSTKPRPGNRNAFQLLENKARIWKTNSGGKVGWPGTYKGFLDFLFLVDGKIACLFFRSWVFQTQQNQHNKKVLGDTAHKITIWDWNSEKLLLLYLQCPSRELLTGVTQLNRYHVTDWFVSHHRQSKYICPFQERARRRGAMIFLCISDKSVRCCYAASVGWILHKHMWGKLPAG